jgi:hypothetical protein
MENSPSVGGFIFGYFYERLIKAQPLSGALISFMIAAVRKEEKS